MEDEFIRRAASSTPPYMPPAHLRDPGDNWVYAPDGTKYWGAFGAAGLLLWHPEAGILLQHRAEWSHNGGTWALPGGARRLNESAETAALREAAEEAGVPGDVVTVLFDTVFDLGYWSYTTVVARAEEHFDPVMGDAESLALEWVPIDDVDKRELHPGFAASWPQLRERLT
ncbi:MAG: NUDIX domain-containing protein [Actinobacteria bacterium]|uniref:Unannotated protein n=1 Tax=freshwater metagenome TaxID=449393 RepID=A0A6J7GM91_9ZZZZ|nr:NUDIX domain-containing protein [Actinomycetota bacterium]